MPPKSGSKKLTVLWYTCEKCRVNVTSRDRDSHEKYCPINVQSERRLSFVRNHVLFTDSLEKWPGCEETKDVPPRQLNNLIFVSESAMKLCSFTIGEKVAVRCVERSELTPLVRLVWPTLDQYLTTVFVSAEDFDANWTAFKGLQLRVERLPSAPLPATEIVLAFMEEENALDSQVALKELEKVLSVRLNGLVFCVGNKITHQFYNKRIALSVTDLKSNMESDGDLLAVDLERLNLAEEAFKRFFIVTTNSTVVIQQPVGKVRAADEAPVKVIKEDIGGLNDVMGIVEEVMNIALGLQKIPYGVKVSRGALLYGPSGCGKTMLCEALANTTAAEVIRVNTNEIFSKFFGETERNLQQYFEAACKNYPRPTLIIVEDVNNICPRTETNELVKRVSASFLDLLDNLHHWPRANRVFVLATTGSIENLNAAARRCGRFDSEIEIGAPSPSARKDILKKHLNGVRHNVTEEQMKEIADVTHAYVCSDIANLIYKAALHAVKMGRDTVDLEDLNFALGQVKPSAMREVLIENPNVRWEDIGGQYDLKLKLKQAIEWPLLYPDKFERLGIKPPRGILMFGPPGCSKTMVAKALATESKVNFLSIKGPELFSMWVGESERAVREVFRKARQVAPSIIFFDEIDAIGGERTSDSGSSVKERVLAQMLTELDGVDALRNVTVIAATNRPDMIDKALLRPGRIDRIVYVGLPDVATRREIFNIKLKTVPVAEDVLIEELVSRTEGYSGAEIQAICNEAAFKALEENLDTQQLHWKHFEAALRTLQPRTSPELISLYDEYTKKHIM